MEQVDVGVQPGDVLAGKYRVEQVLGVGGMGVVVAAHHLQLDERVALKFLRAEALADAETVARFAREARAAVKIKSEHVARVIDVGNLENGAPYIVMEYLEGGDLSGMLARTGPMPFAEAVDFVLQACEAIAQAHALGIVHRDLKPSNLFCIRRPDGQLSIKVLDFGISKAMAGSSSSGSGDLGMTRTTSVVGSPIYMSPEQMQSSKNVDARTDLWSLGVVLYELVTAHVPFEGETVTELAIRVATEPAPPPSAFRADLPPALERVILRCLEKSRERRFQNVAELAAALVEFGSRRAAASLERIQGTLQPGGVRTQMVSSPLLSPGSSTAAAWQSAATPRRGKTSVVLLVGAAVVGAIALGGVLVGTRMTSRAPSSGSGGSAVSATSTAAPSSTVEPPAAVSLALPAEVTPPAPVTPSTAAPATAVPATKPLQGATIHRAVPAPGPAKAKAACDTPYYFDAQGNRVFKKECL
jgi:serine/threonine protein kinase